MSPVLPMLTIVFLAMAAAPESAAAEPSGAPEPAGDGEIRMVRTLARLDRAEGLSAWQVDAVTPAIAVRFDEAAGAVRLDVPAPTENPPSFVASADTLGATAWPDIDVIELTVRSDETVFVPFALVLHGSAFEQHHFVHYDGVERITDTWTRIRFDLRGRRFTGEPPIETFALRFSRHTAPVTLWIREIRLLGEDHAPGIRQLRRHLAHPRLAAHPSAADLRARVDAMSAVGAPDRAASQRMGAEQWRLEEAVADLSRQIWLEDAASRDGAGCGFHYALADSMEPAHFEVFPFLREPGGEATVDLARGETESVQIVLLPWRDTQPVRVSVEPAAAAPGLTLTCDPVGYVSTHGLGSRHFDREAWFPYLVLDQWTPISLQGGRLQPYWLRATASADAEPGEVRGAVRFQAAGENPLEVPFRIRVARFAIPAVNHLPFVTNFPDPYLAFVYSRDTAVQEAYRKWLRGELPREDFLALGDEARQLDDMRERYLRFLQRYRIGPDRMYRPTPPRPDELAFYNEFPGHWFCIRHLHSESSLKAGDPYPEEALAAALADIETTMTAIEAGGYDFVPYVYGFDEVWEHQFAAMAGAFQAVKERWPQLKTITTAKDFTLGVASGADAIDVWVPLTREFDGLTDEIAAARARGRDAGYYVCIVPGPPYANVFVESLPLEARLLTGTMAWGQQVTCFLYYCLNHWTYRGKSSEPYRRPIYEAPLTEWFAPTYGRGNGDGNLFCAGPDGPLPTLQLENLRDGFEDYEYCVLLRDRLAEARDGQAPDGLPASWMTEAEDALQIRGALKDLTRFDREPEALRSWRQTALRLLDNWEALR